MKPKLNINFWNLSGYININLQSKQLIFNLIKKKSSINKFSKKLKISGVSLINFLKNKDSFIRINNFLEIIKKLNLSKSNLEKEIIGYRDTNSKDFFQIKFPFKLSPLHVRIVGSLIGDGHVHKTNNLLRWIQKDVTPMKQLMEFVLQKDIYVKKNSNQIVIPSFFGKIICYSFGLKFSDLDNEKFIEKCLNLPNVYGLVLLLALIEDEGNIDVKNYGGINIRMSSQKVIFAIKKLCDYLGYETSKIFTYKNNNAYFRDNIMYKIKINAEGIRKMGFGLLYLEKKYGKKISLWKKREAFFQRWKKSTNKKAIKDMEGKDIHKRILELFSKYTKLFPSQISGKLGIDYDRVYSLIRNMYKRGELKRIDRGVYFKR